MLSHCCSVSSDDHVWVADHTQRMLVKPSYKLLLVENNDKLMITLCCLCSDGIWVTKAKTWSQCEGMQAVATPTLPASTQPSAECPTVELADPAARPSTPTMTVGCPQTSTTTSADQNSNVVVQQMEANHNHHDCFDETVSLPSTLTLRLIMQGKVYIRHSSL